MTKDELEIINQALEAMRDAHPYVSNDTARNNMGRAIVDLDELLAGISPSQA